MYTVANEAGFGIAIHNSQSGVMPHELFIQSFSLEIFPSI